MESVYMNNFRGFNNTLVPIHSVNFLVGDNSTGKTSFLALTQLLKLPDFWFANDFNAGNYEFGGYKDIVSALSQDTAEFQIGICIKTGKKSKENAYLLMHFREAEDGLPELAKFSQLTKNLFATMLFEDDQVKAAISSDSGPCNNDNSQKACFEYLQDTANTFRLDYKVLHDEDAKFIRKTALPNFPYILSRIFDDKDLPNAFDPLAYSGLIGSLAAMAPIRTKPKRTYDGYTKRFSPEGDHTPYLIREQLAGDEKKIKSFKKALEAFGKDSGLFETVGITEFGDDLASPFELTITLGKKALRINSVGYGVSQALPVVVELLTRSKLSWFAIQQPEVHLHPKAQAALGDVMFHTALDKRHALLVETHSDYLIDRFRLAMRDNKQPSSFAQVIYFERTSDGNCIYPMIIEENGEYPKEQPPGFRKFFLNEQLKILRL